MYTHLYLNTCSAGALLAIPICILTPPEYIGNYKPSDSVKLLDIPSMIPPLLI